MGKMMADAVGGTAAPAPATGAATPQGETKFCGECGNKIPRASKFCPECGAKQE